MTRNEIITLATQLAKSLQDDDTLDVYTNDVFNELALLPSPQMVEAKIKALTSGTSTYSFESDMLSIVYAIMFDELLSPCNEPALDAYSASWQSATGTPTQFTQDVITAREYRLYPTPDFTSDPLIPTYGEPFGQDFPDDSLTLIYADNRESDISPIYALPIALDALSREFAYPSNHTDQNFVYICQLVAQLIYTILGVHDAT